MKNEKDARCDSEKEGEVDLSNCFRKIASSRSQPNSRRASALPSLPETLTLAASLEVPGPPSLQFVSSLHEMSN